MQVHLGVGEHTHCKYEHTQTCKNVHTSYTAKARGYYAAVLSNTLCKNMNTLHRHLSTKCLHNYLHTPADAAYTHTFCAHTKHMVGK